MKKNFTVTFDADAGIIVVQVFGEATHAEHVAAREEAIQLCQSRACSDLLVDLRELSTRRSSTMGSFSFGESLAKAPLFLRIAHVLPRDTRSEQMVRFASTVAANRGKPTGEFKSMEEARQWLLSER